MASTDEEIRAAVKERYAQYAQSGSCCSPSSGFESELYDPDLMQELPLESDVFSLGCGDPVTIAGLQPGEVVLDLGSGAGLDCFLAAKRVGEEGLVIGVDMTPEMIERANQNKSRMGVDNVEFRLGQIEALPVADASVDVILSNCVINLAPDKRAVFQDAFRALKPGGRISVSDIVTAGEFPQSMRTDMGSWAECVAGAIELEAYMRIMKQVGFAQVRLISKSAAGQPEGGPEIFSARIVATKPN